VRSDGLIYVLTGERGSGKSTVCARVARAAAGRGLAVAGILTERQDDADLGSARRVVDVRSGEARLFGSQDRERPRDRNEGAGRAGNGAVPSDPLTPGWEFDSGVFAWASAVLDRSTPCDLLVIDEIGPLELRGGRGWVRALEVLDSAGYRAALVVCRPGLLQELEKRLSVNVHSIVEVTLETRDALPAAMAETLCDALSRP
jgi:nucleoside-triphosphatase THEP1